MPASSASVRSPSTTTWPNLVAERDEVAFRIDDDLLDPLRGLFKQPSQQMRLAGAGIALDEKTGRQKLLDIERRRGVP